MEHFVKRDEKRLSSLHSLRYEFHGIYAVKWTVEFMFAEWQNQ